MISTSVGYTGGSHNCLGCFLFMWGESQEGCRGPILVYSRLWVAVAAEGSGDMFPFCILVCDGGAEFGPLQSCG